jgi:M6 family metalloprotease-like protein
MYRLIAALGFLSFISLHAADDEYRTVDKAITAKIQAGVAAGESIPGHLGVQVTAGPKGQPVIEDVEPATTAERMGLKAGDVVTRFDGKEIATVDAFRTALHSREAGERLQLTVNRNGKAITVATILAPASRPMTSGRAPSSLLGVEVVAREPEGVTIERVTSGSAADKAKLKVGEVILMVDNRAVNGPTSLRDALASKKADDMTTLSLLLAEKRVDMKVRLSELERPAVTGRPGGGGRTGGWNRGYWTKPTYRIAIICIEYPDAKHNAKIAPKDWADAMFSTGGTYKKSATGGETFGSMHDYYLEQSYGNLKIEGKAFDYIELSKKRMEYNTGDRSVFFKEAMDKLLEREGKDALKDFDGVFFIFAGGRLQVARGSLYWPHKSNFSHNMKSWTYFICPEGGERMANISVFCHEFGHMLSLPDLYARPEAPGMEGVGIWSAMANQAGNGRPQHFDAWSKEKLGWIKPVVVDPRVKQKLILSPINDSPKDCVKVLVQPDASEYLLLENRKRKGFDASLPSEGLLIWRVIGNRPILEESHGVAGPSGPRLFPNAVPFPSTANNAFTPYTTPSSRSPLGGGLPVFITNIQKRSDGKIVFDIGYEYQ